MSRQNPAQVVAAPPVPLGDNAQVAARTLYWMGWRIKSIATFLELPRTTVQGWKDTCKWEEASALDRVEGSLECRMVQLIFKTDKDGKDFKEIDLLGRQMTEIAKQRHYEETGKLKDLNHKLGNRGKGERAPNKPNQVDEEQIEKLIEAFHANLFEYQKVWYRAGLHHRIRNILKSRQIGATWYFAREALIDALETGRNQIFLSASKNQALVFRQYIVQFAADVAGVELTGDPIILPNGAELRFLGTNSRTAQSYHGNIYLDEYFWIHRFIEFRKVASGMAMHKKWRQTYISTPSSKQHQAYKFWTGALYNISRRKEERVNFDTGHAALKDGRLCEDGQWRQVVTVEDALAGGCDLFDLDQLRIEYSPDEYENLLMCQFIDDTQSAFSVSELMSCMIDTEELWLDHRPYSPRPLGNHPVWVGYDPALSGDSAGLVVVAAPSTPGGKLRGIERIQFQGADFTAQAEYVRDEILTRYNVEYLGIDATGMGVGFYEEVCKFYPAATKLIYSPELKSQFVLKAKDVIHKGRLEFDLSWTDVVASFVAIHKTLTNSERAVTYKASRSEETGHADLAWAFMHALHHEPLAIGDQSQNMMEMYE